MTARDPGPPIAQGWGSRRVRIALAALGATYLVALGGAGLSDRFEAQVPMVPRFFLQCTCLFPVAAEMRIDYRVEGFACDRKQFVEFDHRPYFPIHADDKESRFHRLGFFYRRNQRVMRSLDVYLADRHNARAAGGRDPGDGILGPIGGIRFLSIRIPFPKVGEPVEPYRVLLLREYPRDWRRPWYMTDPDERRQRCVAARAEAGR